MFLSFSLSFPLKVEALSNLVFASPFSPEKKVENKGLWRKKGPKQRKRPSCHRGDTKREGEKEANKKLVDLFFAISKKAPFFRGRGLPFVGLSGSPIFFGVCVRVKEVEREREREMKWK